MASRNGFSRKIWLKLQHTLEGKQIFSPIVYTSASSHCWHFVAWLSSLVYYKREDQYYHWYRYQGNRLSFYSLLMVSAFFAYSKRFILLIIHKWSHSIMYPCSLTCFARATATRQVKMKNFMVTWSCRITYRKLLFILSWNNHLSIIIHVIEKRNKLNKIWYVGGILWIQIEISRLMLRFLFPDRWYLKPRLLKCEWFIQRHHKFLEINSTDGHFVKNDCQKDEV